MPSKLLLCLVVSSALAGAASAELQWDKPVQEAKGPQGETVEFRFAFRNAGQTTVNIKAVHPSCQCTTAELTKRAYAPGEKGEIVAEVDLAGVSGELHKTIDVLDDEDPNRTKTLQMIIKVQQSVVVNPQFLFWRIGEKNDPRQVQITSDPANPMQVTGVTSSNPRIAANVQTVTKGQQYVVQVTPDSTADRQTADLTIQTDTPVEAPRAYTVHVRIK